MDLASSDILLATPGELRRPFSCSCRGPSSSGARTDVTAATASLVPNVAPGIPGDVAVSFSETMNPASLGFGGLGALADGGTWGLG